MWMMWMDSMKNWETIDFWGYPVELVYFCIVIYMFFANWDAL